MIQLIAMAEKKFQAYLKEETARYAEANVKAGRWKKTEALKKSVETHNKLLPKGMATHGHHFFIINADDKKSVGTIWIYEDRRPKTHRGFIYDLFIKKPYRGKGIATQAMLLLEEKAKQLGLEELRLHVFDFNENAKHLYEKLGYQRVRATSGHMTKQL